MSAHETARGGFSLVEVVVALMILTVGLLAMAAATGYVATEVRSAGLRTQRAAAVEQVVEQLRATPFSSLASSTSPRQVGRFQVSWVVTPVNTNLAHVSITSTGPGVVTGGGPQSSVTEVFTASLARSE